MATTPQILANRNNARSSTGPVTAEGKARSARNAVSFGLFSAPGFVRSGEEDHYAEFCDEYQAGLAPQGAVENTLAAEILHAAWRLRRCVQIEANIDGKSEWEPDAADGESKTESLLRSVSRARASAQRTFHRSIAELRRLQTERRFRKEYLPKNFDLSEIGLASLKDLAPVMCSEGVQRQMRSRDGGMYRDILSAMHPPTVPENASEPESGQFTKQSQTRVPSTPATPRNAPCPCNSGLKFKRCCALRPRFNHPGGATQSAVLDMAA